MFLGATLKTNVDCMNFANCPDAMSRQVVLLAVLTLAPLVWAKALSHRPSDLLVRDLRAVERGDIALLSDGVDSLLTPALLSQRVVKDRYDVLFGEMCRRQAQAHRVNLFPPPGYSGDTALEALASSLRAYAPLLDQLRSLRARMFVSTEIGLRGCKPDKDFSANSAALKALLHSFSATGTAATMHRTPGLIDGDWDDDEDRSNVNEQELRCLFNVTCLPTHTQVAGVFRWLDPTGGSSSSSSSNSGPAPTTTELLSPLRPGADVGHDLLVPASWLYFTSTPLLKVCELLTSEYMDALSAYLAARIASFSTPVTLLELGAGNGRLVHLLQREIVRHRPDLAAAGRFSVVAADHQGNVGDATSTFPVLKLDNDAALRDLLPSSHAAIVIVSWMTKDADWTAAIRSSPSVQEYILVGEKDYGACGHPKQTWGAPNPLVDSPWERDRFERIDLDELSLLQISRTDSPYVRFHSQTVLFRRRG